MNPKDQRVCPTCGGPRYRKAKQCASCAVRSGADHPNWKGDAAQAESKRNRARKRYPLGVACETDGCEAPAVDRHHVDGDTGNNEPSNIARLCRRHHMEADGRLADLAARAGEAGRLGGNPYGRLDAPRDANGRFLPDVERSAA